VEHLHRVLGEDVAVAAGALHAVAQVLGRVLGGELVYVEPPVSVSTLSDGVVSELSEGIPVPTSRVL